MTWWQVYWWLKLDDIGVFIGMFTGLIATVFVVWIIGLFCYDLEYPNKTEKECFFIPAKILLPIIILLSLSLTFLPSSKQYALIKILPMVANSEIVTKEIPAEAREMYKIAKDYLKEKLSISTETEAEK